MDEAVQERLLCSTWAREANLSSAGTAGYYQGFLLLEWPLPWPRDVSDISSLSEIAALAKKFNIRLQLIVRDDQNRSDKRLIRVACYHGLLNTHTLAIVNETSIVGNRVPNVSFYSGFGLMETFVTQEKAPEAAFQILVALSGLQKRRTVFWSDSFGTLGDQELPTLSLDEENAKVMFSFPSDKEIRVGSEIFDHNLATKSYDGTSVRDVLVCTHGRRDRCCGSLGTNLHKELSSGALFGEMTGRRLYRTSHTGGHRFAPTAILLPQGSLWAFLDGKIVELILSEDPDCSLLKPYFRGSVGLEKSELQVVEAELFAEWGNLFPGENGWSFLRSSRAATLSGDRVTFYVISSQKRSVTINARIVEKRKIPAWDCGDVPGYQQSGSGAKESYIEYEVTDLDLDTHLSFDRTN